jgi:hypothetical protein
VEGRLKRRDESARRLRSAQRQQRNLRRDANPHWEARLRPSRFSSQTPGSPITDIPPVVRDNGDLNWGSQQCARLEDGPQSLPQTHSQCSLTLKSLIPKYFTDKSFKLKDLAEIPA